MFCLRLIFWGEGYFFKLFFSKQKNLLYLTPVVNFGEVRRASYPNPFSPPRWCPWDLFRCFKVCSDAQERVGCRKQREGTAIKSLVELQPWFLSLRWKTCLWQNCNLGFSTCSEGPCLWAEHSDDDIHKLKLFLQIKIKRKIIHVNALPSGTFTVR